MGGKLVAFTQICILKLNFEDGNILKCNINLHICEESKLVSTTITFEVILHQESNNREDTNAVSSPFCLSVYLDTVQMNVKFILTLTLITM